MVAAHGGYHEAFRLGEDGDRRLDVGNIDGPAERIAEGQEDQADRRGDLRLQPGRSARKV